MAMGMDFAPRPTWRRTGIVVLLAGAIGSAHALWQRHALLQQRAAVLSQIEAQQRVAVKHRPSDLRVARPEARVEMKTLVAGLQRPWQAMLNALQAAIKDDVSVTRVQPEADAFRLRIAGQADSSRAFVDFVQRLQDDASWRVVEPLSEARQPEAGESGKALTFVLAAEWRQP
jgi:hypothetical protein